MVLYDLNDKSHAEQSRILRELFGFTDKSNNGRYEYERPGLLSKIRFERKTKTALVIEKKNGRQVVQALIKAGIISIITVALK
ncbi:MAG: hypothetical protein V1787_00010 [Candidatus Micrarchaeota archaeon]